MTIASKVTTRINRSKRYVFERADFADIAGYDQVGRVLKKLVDSGQLLRIGYGLYTKARENRITGKLMPASPAGADGVILEAIEKSLSEKENRTKDLGGDANTLKCSNSILANL